ncbi:MAG TPA: hypothetical protein VGJ70_15620, partial [Solirubrobacteraceae bacterium]
MARRFPFAAALVASLTAAAPAHAVISSPPAAPHEVTVFPERDFVVVDGWPANKDFKLEVLRNGVVVGSALGTTDADGLAEVNHPGGFCWTGFTPDILPGDVLQATEIGAPTVGDATRTAGVSAEQATVVGSQLVVHGRAVSATGGPIPLGNLEQRIIEPALVGLVGRRDVRAPGGGNGFSSTLSYDPVGPANPDGTRWTARYTGMSGAAMDTAAGGETRILTWMTANAAGDRFGITIFEAGVTGGPGFGGCPAAASNAVTAPGSLNAAALAPGAADVVFAGAAQPDATAVSLKISDGTTTIDVPATAVTLAGGAWTASVPAAQLAALADG